MPRGRKKKLKLSFDIKAEVVRSIVVVVLLLLWLLSLVSFFAPNYSLNAKINTFWHGMFGDLAFVAPMLLLLAAVFLVERIKTRFKEPRILIGIFLLFLTILGFAHVFLPTDRAYDIASDGGGGGMLGFYIASLLTNSISKYGAVAFLICLFVISVVVLFNVTIEQFYDKGAAVLSHLNVFGGIKSALAKKQAVDDSEVEVTSGMPIEEDDSDEFFNPRPKEVPQKEPVQEEFAFEVVPSLSEPQTDQKGIDNPAAVNTLINDVKPSALPYVDAIWRTPPMDLLADYPEAKVDNADVLDNGKKIKEALHSFDIDVELEGMQTGPAVTQYALKAESGVKVSKIASLQNDIAMALASPTGSVRIEAPIPGRSAIGIEVPNKQRSVVGFRNLITSDSMKNVKSKLGIVLGKDVTGSVFVYDIAKMPHMLIAGTTGSGKSIFIHNLIFSILFRANPNEVKFVLIDPKRVELIHYQDIPHLMTPVITDMSKASTVFNWAVSEMERRYVLFEKARVRNIDSYNKESGFQALPYIVIIVEELGELMQVDPNGVEKSIIRLAQLARATGIHLVLTVQRPDTKIITGLIKANIPCRVAFNVMSQIDSRVIIDQPGAEKLLGKGDMLFIPPDMSRPIRLQGAFVSEKEVADLVTYLKAQGVAPDYREEIFQTQQSAKNANTAFGNDVDELFDQAVDIVTLAGKASASLLQRKLSIGYARAARIIDELEQNGIIGPADGQKPRDVIGGNSTAGSGMGGYDDPLDNDVNSISV